MAEPALGQGDKGPFQLVAELATPVSDLMARENHILTVVPKAEVDREFDWRLPVFGSGPYLVAFDGAALLLLELWKKRHKQ